MPCYRDNAHALAMMRNLPAAAKFVRTSLGGGFWQSGSCPTPIGSMSCPAGAKQQVCDAHTCRGGATAQRRQQTGFLPGTGPYRGGAPRPYAGRHAYYQGCGGAGQCGGGCAPGGTCGCYDCRNAYGWASRYWGYGYRTEGCARCQGGCTGACITPGY